MGRVFRINTINSDLSEAKERLITFVIKDDQGKPILTDSGEPVTFMLRPISETQRRQIESNNTTAIPARKGQPPRKEVDWDAYVDEMASLAIVSWTNVVGADNKTLPCVHEAKIALDGTTKNEVLLKATQGEAADSAESFRPTA